MEKQTIIGANQRVTTDDFASLASNPGESIDHLSRDLSGIPAPRYTGFAVEQVGSSTVRVAPGRVHFADGRVFLFESEPGQTIDLLGIIPATAQKIVTIVAISNTIETDLEPRTFLVDPVTRVTEGREVRTTRARIATPGFIQGAENATAQPPAVPADQVAIAHVLLTPSGIQSITPIAANRHPSLYGHSQSISAINSRLSAVGPQIDTLRSDISGLSLHLQTKASNSEFRKLLDEVIRLKDIARLPDDYASYGGDLFLDDDESDTAFAGYAARTHLGLRFPSAGSVTVPIQLANALDPAVKVEGNMVLPAHDSVVRLSVVAKDSEYPLTNTTQVTQELRQVTEARSVSERVGSETITYDANTGQALTLGYRGSEVRPGYTSTSSWSYDYGAYGKSNLVSYTYPKYETSTYYETRNEWVSVTQNVTGSFMAQTFLNSQEGFLTGFNLYFSKKASSGDVRVMVVDVDASGRPLFDRLHEQKVLTPGEINVWPAATPVAIKPMHVRKGQRYAIILASSNAHFVCQVAGNKFAQGALFYLQDGEWVQNNANLDMAFEAKFAEFESSRLVVGLAPLELAGGMDSIRINHDVAAPEGTAVHFEIRVNNVWRSLLEGVNDVNLLDGRPSLVQFRAVLTGTTDVMPAFGVGVSRSEVTLTRPATSMTHISKPRILAAPTSSIEVRVRILNWDDANHTVACAVLHGSSYGTVKAADVTTTETVMRPDGLVETLKTFVFNVTSLSDFRFRITGGTGSSAKTWHALERLDIES